MRAANNNTIAAQPAAMVAGLQRRGAYTTAALRELVGTAAQHPARVHRRIGGSITERFSVDSVEAFELLTRLSQSSNTKLDDLAQALIGSEHPLEPRHR